MTLDLWLPVQTQDINCFTIGTIFHCLVTKVHVYVQLAQGCYLAVKQLAVKLTTSWVANRRLYHQAIFDRAVCTVLMCVIV